MKFCCQIVATTSQKRDFYGSTAGKVPQRNYSHSLPKSISGISKWRICPVCSLFQPKNMPFSLLSHWSQRACPHFDLTICPRMMVKTKRLKLYYYFGMMRTVSGVSQVAFEWAYFSLAEVSYCGQKFRPAYR